ncbi:unnamed protein product [Phaedon cochleariae]|uniref:Membrane protein BRI3 n=1 Tax=Phaedon cochleariae TaxID=80249 RepID=A0A9N9SGH5_PHACE|nr:unnamed protein product [Phaedon cochleariae]
MQRPINSPPPYEPGFKNADGYGHPYPPSSPQSMPMPMNSGMNYPSAPPPRMHQPAPTTTSTVVVVGGGGGGGLPGCPVCHNNSWGSTWGCCAWMWLICCFPIGILCCLCMREKKCTQCGYTIG